jgi:sugar phosphate isomerase/epimerase
VHLGGSLETALEQIDLHASEVRSQVAPEGRLPLGLWFSQSVVNSILDQAKCDWLRDWLDSRNFLAYTFNGFPQGDFHQPVVKHAVYEPTWTCESRSEYTRELALIMDQILPAGHSGSISTLPLGWPHAPWHAENYKLAADHLTATAMTLARLTESRGSELVLAIEPEPGCVLERADDLIDFFQKYLLNGPEAHVARQHLAICHDICHSSVMFEAQQDVLDKYLSAGIRIGKVQVSSAVHVPWDEVADHPERQAQLLEQVRSFDEPKYLHQTTRCNQAGKLDGFCEDLGVAFDRWAGCQLPVRPWRIHFHLPIFLERFGRLCTTRQEIHQACQFLEKNRSVQVAGRDWFTGHYEVETYAWSVLPEQLRGNSLASGIAQELQYFQQLMSDL